MKDLDDRRRTLNTNRSPTDRDVFIVRLEKERRTGVIERLLSDSTVLQGSKDLDDPKFPVSVYPYIFFFKLNK